MATGRFPDDRAAASGDADALAVRRWLADIGHRVRAVHGDTTQGASALAQEAVCILADAALAYPGQTGLSGYLDLIATSLIEAKPAMAAVHNAVEAFNHTFRASGAGPGCAAEIRDRILEAMFEASKQAAQTAAEVIPDGATIVTCSTSSSVVAAAREARAAGKRVRFLVLASIVGESLHGARLCALLKEAGVASEMRPDAAALMAVADADLALVGADRVLPLGGLVNGCPSLALAEACERRIPFYSVCETFKLDPAFYPWGVSAPDSGNNWSPPTGFDRLPATLVSLYLTDKGLFRPIQVAAGEAPRFRVG